MKWIDARALTNEHTLDVDDPLWESMKRSAESIKTGGLVGMPTETVYGIAADALNASAVEKIFQLKERPNENPLIVHIAHFSDVFEIADAVPRDAWALAEKFWPGPLTIVLPKKSVVPDVTTAGLNSVAIRLPAHPVARSLIMLSNRFIAAPSANKFMRLSPTRAADVDPDIGHGLDYLIDGGHCEQGIESTVIDLTDEPVILRPGSVSQREIEAILGRPIKTRTDGDRSSPGMYKRHYSPRSKVMLVDGLGTAAFGLTLTAAENEGQVEMPTTSTEYAQRLYAELASLDRLNPDIIEIQKPPTTPEWDAIWDRLNKIVG